MKKLLSAVVVMFAALAFHSSAHADAAYYEHITATPILRSQVSSSFFGGTQTFETTNLQAAPGGCPPFLCPVDTFMVVRAPNGQHYFNDNWGSSRRSRVSVNYVGSGTFTITVFSANGSNGGLTDVVYTSSSGSKITLDSFKRFGGTILQPAIASANYKYQTAHNVDGAMASRIVVYNSSWQEKDYGSGNGIGLAAEANALWISGDRIVVGSMSEASSGSTALFVDRCTQSPEGTWDPECDGTKAHRDPDGDNLSTDLEVLLETSPDDLDSDNDGLYDYYEVIGRRTSTVTEEEFRALGADPLRRDLFFELDRRSDISAPNETFVETIQAAYDNIPSLPPDPAGTQRIAIHGDIGVPCSNPTLCGDWGGHDLIVVLPLIDSNDPRDYWTEQSIKNDNRLGHARRGTFHYVLRWQDCPAAGQGRVRSFESYVCLDNGLTAAHELGHNLGLCHWGGGQYDRAALNLKMNYPSIMNYLYSYNGTVGFSAGAMQSIDPMDLDEHSWSPAIDKSLHTDKYDYELCSDPLAGPCTGATPEDAIDWNRDGRWTAGGVQFDVTVPRQESADRWPIGDGAGQIQSDIPWGGPGLAESDGVLYAFAVVTSTLKWSRATGTEGPWTPWQTMSTGFTPAPDGETAAVAYPFGLGNRILVVHPDSLTDRLHYAVFDVDTESVTESGVIPGWPAGVRARQASMTAVTGGAIAPSIDVVFREIGTDNHVWLARLDPFVGWLPWTLQEFQIWGQQTCTWGPAIAQGSMNGQVYLACPAPSGDLSVWERSNLGTNGIWEIAHLDSDDMPDPPMGRINDPPRFSMVTLPYLTAAGLPFADGSEYLAIYFPHVYGDEENWSRVYVGPLGPTISSFNNEKAVRFTQASTSAAWREHSLGVTRRGNGVAVLYTSRNGTSRGPMWHVPYGNSLSPGSQAEHVDWADGATIAANMCSSWCWEGNGDRCVDPTGSGDSGNRCGDDAPTGSCSSSGGAQVCE